MRHIRPCPALVGIRFEVLGGQVHLETGSVRIKDPLQNRGGPLDIATWWEGETSGRSPAELLKFTRNYLMILVTRPNQGAATLTGTVKPRPSSIAMGWNQVNGHLSVVTGQVNHLACPQGR